MQSDVRIFVIIKPRPSELPIIEFESEWLYKMKIKAGVGTQADDVTRVRGNFRFEQYDIGHSIRPVAGAYASHADQAHIRCRQRPQYRSALAPLAFTNYFHIKGR
jgi:hypothetical protein